MTKQLHVILDTKKPCKKQNCNENFHCNFVAMKIQNSNLISLLTEGSKHNEELSTTTTIILAV